MSEEKFSQSFSGSELSGGVQVGQAGRDVVQSQQVNPTEKQIKSADVVELLTRIEELLQGANLAEPEKEKAVRYLNAAKEEVQQKEPDKDLAAKSLKRVTETLKNANETVEASTGLWKNVQPILTQLLGWLGVAKSFFGY